MKKRILSVLLCLVMVLGLLPTAAFAAKSNNGYPNYMGWVDRGYGLIKMSYTRMRPYSTWTEARDAGCAVYLDLDGVFHFLNDVTDENSYVEGSGYYDNYLNISYDNYVNEGTKKVKIWVHQDVTVNLHSLYSAYDTEIVLDKGAELNINYDRNTRETNYHAIAIKGNLMLYGYGTLNVRSTDRYKGEGAIYLYHPHHSFYIGEGVSVDVTAYRSAYGEGRGCIDVGNKIVIDTTGYVKVNYVSYRANSLSPIHNAINCKNLALYGASSVEISSTDYPDYGCLMWNKDYSNIKEAAESEFPGWDVESEGTTVSGWGLSLAKLYRSYVKITREGLTEDGVSNVTLTADGTEFPSVNSKTATGTITAGESSKTFTITATAANWLRTLVNDKRAEYTLTALVFRGTDLLWEDTDYTVTTGSDSDGNPNIKVNLTKAPAAGDVYSIAAFVKPVAKGTENQLCDPAYGSWTLTTELSKTLTGTVHYTSSAVYDKPISVGFSGLPEGFDTDSLTRQWQRSTNGGSSWTDIEDATKNTYTPTAADMGEDVRLRVKMTAEGWYGELVSAPVKVSKAANNDDPGIPALTAVEVDGSYTQFKITYYKEALEYVYTDSAVNGWPTSGTSITSDTVSGLTSGKTYYVYARYKGTDTTETGTVARRSSVLLDEATKLNKLVLSDSEGNAYTDYGAGNTIYVKVGERVTLNVAKNPSNANTWSAYTFGPDSGSTTKYTVTDPTGGNVAANTNIESITIEGKESGKETLVAQYSGYTPQYYGRWNVVVYEDVSKIDFANITINNKPAFPNVTMYKGETAAVPKYDPLTTSPANALGDYTFEWRVMKPAAGLGSQPTYVKENDYLEVTADGNGIKALKNTAGADSKYQTVALCAVKGKSVYEIASYRVTVTDAPEIALTGLTVSPTKVYLDLNGTTQLTAAKTPVNAKGDLTWTSSNSNIAKVDDEGNVTAVAEGTAEITVTCGGKTVTCTVLVDHEHSYGDTWTSGGNAGHYRTCSDGDCGFVETAPHSFTQWIEVDNDTHRSTCDTEGCGVAATASHTWVYDETSSTPATEIKEGTAVYTCFCGATKTETIAKLPPSDSGSDSGSGGGVSAYTVTVKDSQHGTVTADRKTASYGATVTLTVKPDQGWTLETLTAINAGGKEIDLNIVKIGEKYTFKMPASNVAVTATFMEDNTILNYFVDVPTDSYYYDAVLWAVEQGITQGTDATHFSPDGICTRAQAVTFLWRAAGSPAPKSSTMPFTDVKSGVYYYDAVLWAVENGITRGTTDTTFSPNMNCSRAQIVTFLWRSEQSPAAGTVNPFTDVKSDAYYADAVLWAVKEDVTKGTTSTTFSPDANCTRAQIVTFIWRCMK